MLSKVRLLAEEQEKQKKLAEDEAAAAGGMQEQWNVRKVQGEYGQDKSQDMLLCLGWTLKDLSYVWSIGYLYGLKYNWRGKWG